MIEIDEFDISERHIFNYGHTFGHAIESITNYEIVHGQAVTIGMDIANFISWKLNDMTRVSFISPTKTWFVRLTKRPFSRTPGILLI